MSEIKVDTVAEKTSANGVTVDGLNIKDSKLVTANSVITSNITDANITTAKIADDNVTYAKIQNVSATDRILGRDSSGAGVIEEITPANLRTMLNVADGATAGGGGKVLQVVSDTLTSEYTTGSASFTDTGLTLNITPSATSSKILMIAHLGAVYSNTSLNHCIFTGLRDSTNLGHTNYGFGFTSVSTDGRILVTDGFTFLDSPSTTTATNIQSSRKIRKCNWSWSNCTKWFYSNFNLF